MKQLRKFLSLSGTDQGLLVESLLLLAAITLGLRLISFQALQRVLTRLARRSSPLPADQPSARRIARAVRTASRFIPAATCLPQALATQILLKRQACPTRLFIGVAKDEDGELEAHAWVESQGQIVIGELDDLSRFVSLPSLEGYRR